MFRIALQLFAFTFQSEKAVSIFHHFGLPESSHPQCFFLGKNLCQLGDFKPLSGVLGKRTLECEKCFVRNALLT